MGRTRDTSKILTTVENIDVTEQLDERIFISSASPTAGNTDGRLWIDTTSASAPAISIYGQNNWRDPRPRVKAFGGIKTQFGIYTIHTFLGTENFVALEALNIEYLVVGGGGGGGTARGGGGGAGGYRSSVFGETSGRNTVAESPILVSPGTYAVTIGAGGSSNTNGVNSQFSSIISNGGGRGGDWRTTPGGNGGAGGGSPDTATLGLGTSGQGFDGGRGSAGPSDPSGGGGGASSSGGSNTSGSGNGGNGGNGITSFINGVSTIRSGGGGGGVFSGSGIGGLGGSGGGGQGAFSTNNGVSASSNSGSGGGGGSDNRSPGNGGSGIVIIRYLT
jgi:hypothetical protein